jgi:hypothetical protein
MLRGSRWPAELHLPHTVERAVHIALLDFPRPPQLDAAAAIGAAHSGATEPDGGGVD